MKRNRLFENYYKLSREQRIQWKKYLCVLGAAFLLFLLLINLLHSCAGGEEEFPEQEETLPQHIPVIRDHGGGGRSDHDLLRRREGSLFSGDRDRRHRFPAGTGTDAGTAGGCGTYG